MNCNLPKITYLTLRTLLLLKIYQAICQKADVELENCLSIGSKVGVRTTNYKQFQQLCVLRQVRNQTSVVLYRSPIALQLGEGSSQVTARTVSQITEFFQFLQFDSASPEIENQILCDLTVRATETGLLEFEFGEAAIVAWLQMVLQNCGSDNSWLKSKNTLNQMLSENPEIFFCQYSYARCTALLRLVNPQKLQAVGWARDGKLLLNRERSLVAQIVTTLDEWENEAVLKNTTALSQAFQSFYQNCQIVKYDTIDCEIMHRRLALVMITHWLLKQLLEQGLGVLAPETL